MGKWRRNKSLEKRWQRSHLIKKYGMTCYVCDLPILHVRDITLDHLLPLSKGGGDSIDNLRLAHLSCNYLKADMTPQEFEEFQKGGKVVE